MDVCQYLFYTPVYACMYTFYTPVYACMYAFYTSVYACMYTFYTPVYACNIVRRYAKYVLYVCETNHRSLGIQMLFEET